MKKFGELYEGKKQLEGERINKQDLIGKEIEIHDWVEFSSQSRPEETFFVIQGKLDGKLITFTSGIALKNQLKNIKESERPFKATIEQRESKQGGKYYLFV